MTRRQIDPLRTLTRRRRTGGVEADQPLNQQTRLPRGPCQGPVGRGRGQGLYGSGPPRRAACRGCGRPPRQPLQSGKSWGPSPCATVADRKGATVQSSTSKKCSRIPRRTPGSRTRWDGDLVAEHAPKGAAAGKPDGLPHVSTYTIGLVLHEAGFAWQASRTWCETGKVKRKRKSGVVDVCDPDAEPKKS